MIVKFFGSRGGGTAKASLDYLKNKPDGKARVLQGDPDLSQNLAENLNFKNKYTVGCLSFEEKNISEKDKYEIMERFEKTLFAGLKKDQYNITWIEHTDKDRLELNFFIPNVELHTEKRLQPYYDKADRGLVDNFKKVINYEYQLTDPDDPTKKQITNTLSVKNIPKSSVELKKQIDDTILSLIQNNVIKDRADVLNVLKESGFEISRTSDNSISLKNPDPTGRNIRLKGAIYEVNARFGEQLTEQINRDITEYQYNKSRAYEQAAERLASYTRSRTEFNQKTFKRNDQVYQVAHVIGCNNRSNTNALNSISNMGLDNQQQYSRDISSTEHNITNSERQKISKIMEQNQNIRTKRQNIDSSSHEFERNMENKAGRKRFINSIMDQVTDYAKQFTKYCSRIIDKIGTREREFNNTEQSINEINQSREKTEVGINSVSQRVKDTDQTIREQQQFINRAEQTINTERENWNRNIEQIERKISEIEPKSIERGWSMSL